MFVKTYFLHKYSCLGKMHHLQKVGKGSTCQKVLCELKRYVNSWG